MLESSPPPQTPRTPPAAGRPASLASARADLRPPDLSRSDSPPDAFDIDFTVPQRHRLRFTEDVFGRDARVLVDLIVTDSERPPRVLAYCDASVAAAREDFAATVAHALGGDVELVTPLKTVVGGEACKNDPAVVDRLLHDINRFDLDRRSYVLAIGGGAVLDVVGYAAAIAHRGIRLIRVPATTLAQDDSGVGVKNAVNGFGKKNWKGTFACPWAVINDRRILDTLSDRAFRAGFSEAVKVALLKDAAFFGRIRRTARQIAARDWDAAGPVIRQSALWHLRHITAGGDPFEALEARPLDFGHWSAHRLEAMSDYSVPHGEAVAIGLAIDCTYSMLRHGLPREDRDAVLATLWDLGLPTSHPLLNDADRLLAGLEEFRQHLGGRLTVTMLTAPGRAIDVHTIDEAAMHKAVAAAAGE